MIPVQNTVLTSTFDFWRNRTNELANYMSTCVITTDANSSTVAATGNASLVGTFTANVFSAAAGTANLVANSSMLKISNSTVNTSISLPTTSQYGNNFFLAANGTWISIPIANASQTFSGNNIKLVDSYPMTTYSGAEYLLTVTDNNANNRYTSKVLTTHDTTNGLLTEYASFTTNTFTGTFTASANTTHVLLYFTPVSTNTTVKYVRTLI